MNGLLRLLPSASLLRHACLQCLSLTTCCYSAARNSRRALTTPCLPPHSPPPCAADQENYTPLYKAVGGSCEAIVKLLLERGADVSIANSMAQMPIHFAR